MLGIFVLGGIVIGRGWRWVIDMIAEESLHITAKPNQLLAFYVATSFISGAIFSMLPFGPAPFTDARRYFHAGLIAGFLVFRALAEGIGTTGKPQQRTRGSVYLLGSLTLTVCALGAGYFAGSIDQIPV